MKKAQGYFFTKHTPSKKQFDPAEYKITLFF